MTNIDNKLVVSNAGTDRLMAFSFENDKVQSIEICDDNSIVGNIYVGIVSDVVQNINAAFIAFGNGEKGYYSITDNSPVFLNIKNTDKVCSGDRVLVQVLSDKIKTKDYTLTSNINLTGKYIVLTVGNSNINVSKKITDNQVRTALKTAVSHFSNDEYGFIIRTSAAKVSVEEIINETEIIISKWNSIKEKSKYLTATSCIYKQETDIFKITKNALEKDFHKVMIEDEELYNHIFDELNEEYENAKDKIVLYKDKLLPMHKLYSLETCLESALNKRVWLKSGAYLVIEHTEAFHSIDVNTGKVDKKGSREDIFFKINIEAAHEIARQIRLRNLSGIIIIDFINMKSEENNEKLIKEMKMLTAKDDIRTIVAGLTNLGLMELTRKRKKKPIYEELIMKKS